jgi:hypothetical protein
LLKFIKANKDWYQRSLRRDFFCVSDKVSVSGTTFTVVFAWVYGLNMAANLAHGWISKEWQFYIIGVPYLGYALFCLHTYRTYREMCFYCKYSMVQNPLVMTIMVVFYLESTPKWYLISAFGLTFLSLFARGWARRQRAKQLRKKQEKREMGRIDYEKFE